MEAELGVKLSIIPVNSVRPQKHTAKEGNRPARLELRSWVGSDRLEAHPREERYPKEGSKVHFQADNLRALPGDDKQRGKSLQLLY